MNECPGRGRPPEGEDYDEDNEDNEELDELEEETVLRNQLGHVPGRLPASWVKGAAFPSGKEISLDHASEKEWEDFLKSLEEDE